MYKKNMPINPEKNILRELPGIILVIDLKY